MKNIKNLIYKSNSSSDELSNKLGNLITSPPIF